MLPPLDISISYENPKFKSLYENLAGKVLNPDGSVKLSDGVIRQHTSLEEELLAAQHAAAKVAIIRSTLTQLYSHNLPDELKDVILLISAPPIPKDELRLAEFLRDHGPDLTPLGLPVSEELSLVRDQLLGVADLSSKQACTVDHIAKRKDDLEWLRTKLYDERLGLANAACTVFESQQDICMTAIQTLESVKYGSVARADTAQTGYLTAAAEGLDAKLRVMKLEALHSIYDPDVKTAIDAYRTNLTQVKSRLKSRDRLANERLDQYDEVGRSMGEIANRYVELVQEIGNVKAQISRLNGGED